MIHKLKFTITLLLNFFLINVHAGNENYHVGARSTGMANATVMLCDVWSVHHNQAGLAYLENPSIGFHHENKFIVPEYGLQSFVAAIPIDKGTIGVNLSYFGYSKYNESKIGLGYAKKISDYFSAGIQLNYVGSHIGEEYGNAGTAVAEVGILSQPIENLFIGAHLYNPTRSKMDKYSKEKIPTIMRIGAGYKFSDTFFIGIETEKDLDYKAILKIGTEFSIVENVYFRTGVSTSPTLTYFGIGYKLGNLKADIAFSRSQILGITPHFSFTYTFKKPKE